MEQADRFKTVHVRHEDVDDHHVERGPFKRVEPAFCAVGDHDFKVRALEPGANCRADQWIVVDDENACHGKPPADGLTPLTLFGCSSAESLHFVAFDPNSELSACQRVYGPRDAKFGNS